MKNGTLIKPLSESTEDIPIFVEFFRKEWPDHYGEAGPGDAQRDIESYANGKDLPIALAAYHEGTPCGLMALKPESITSHSHMGPWVAAGFVLPQFRNQGIGAELLFNIENLASNMHFKKLYSGTSGAHGLLARSGWKKEETVLHGGESVSIYSKQL